jgi:hypothetical protein
VQNADILASKGRAFILNELRRCYSKMQSKPEKSGKSRHNDISLQIHVENVFTTFCLLPM